MSVIIPGIDGQNKRIRVQPENVSWLRLRISGSTGGRARLQALSPKGGGAHGCRSHVQPGGFCQIYVLKGGEARDSKLCVQRKKKEISLW